MRYLSTIKAQGDAKAGQKATASICAGGDRYIAPRDKRTLEAEAICCGFHPQDFLIDATQLHKKSSAGHSTRDFTVTVWNLRNRRTATYIGGAGRTWVAAFLQDLMADHFGTPSMSSAANHVHTDHLIDR
jgi:hypothetical protein